MTTSARYVVTAILNHTVRADVHEIVRRACRHCLKLQTKSGSRFVPLRSSLLLHIYQTWRAYRRSEYRLESLDFLFPSTHGNISERLWSSPRFHCRSFDTHLASLIGTVLCVRGLSMCRRGFSHNISNWYWECCCQFLPPNMILWSVRCRICLLWDSSTASFERNPTVLPFLVTKFQSSYQPCLLWRKYHTTLIGRLKPLSTT